MSNSGEHSAAKDSMLNKSYTFFMEVLPTTIRVTDFSIGDEKQ